MATFHSKSLGLLAAVLMLLGFQVANAQENGTPFPKPSAGFTPKLTYEMDLSKAWVVATTALNDNQIPIESASKDANQIRTGYRVGPSDGGGVFVGKLITQYKYVVSFVPISSSQTQIKVGAIIEARRLASGVGKALGGNNAVSDEMWHEATADNPAEVLSLQNWLYEQIEKKEASVVVPTANARPSSPSPASQSSSAPSSAEPIEVRLEKLKELRSKKVITEAEYKAMRAKALGL